MQCLTARRAANPVTRDTPETIYAKLGDLSGEDRVLICFPFRADRKSIGGLQLVSQGFLQDICRGAVWTWSGLSEAESGGFGGAELLVIVDRLLWGKAARKRILDSITTAYKMGEGRMAAVVMPDRVMRFSSELSCADCTGASPIPPESEPFFL